MKLSRREQETAELYAEIHALQESDHTEATAERVLTAKHLGPLLAESGRGSVINVSSIYGVSAPDFRIYEGAGFTNPVSYSAGKAGVIGLTRHLATLWAPRVRVNALSPGGIFRGHEEPFKSKYEERTPMGRMGSEEDMIGAAVYLASDMSAYVTGQNIIVDGGLTAW